VPKERVGNCKWTHLIVFVHLLIFILIVVVILFFLCLDVLSNCLALAFVDGRRIRRWVDGGSSVGRSGTT